MKSINVLPVAFYFILCFSFYNISAQERVSNILGGGTGQRIILQEYEGINYIITIKPNDVVTVYTESNGILFEQYNQLFSGLHNQGSFKTTQSHLLVPSSQGLVAYNFTNDDQFLYPYPDGFDKATWYGRIDKREELFVLVSSTVNGAQQRMFVDLLNYTYEILPANSWYLNIEDNYIRERRTGTLTQEHILINRQTGEREIMYEGTTIYGGQSTFNNYGFAYVSEDDRMVLLYDFETNLTETLMVLPEEYIDVKVCGTNSNYVIFLETESGKSDVHLYDKDRNLIGEYESDVMPNSVYPEIIAGKILGEDFRFFTIDTISGVTTDYNYSFRDYIIFEGHKMLISYNSAIHYLDLLTGINFERDNISTVGSTAGFTHVFTSGDTLLINIDSQSDDSKTLYRFKNASLRSSDLFDDLYGGLSFSSYLTKLEEGIAISDKATIYQLTGLVVDKMNDRNISNLYNFNSSIHLFDKEVCWLQNEQGLSELNCIKNGEVATYGPYPDASNVGDISRIYDYGLSGDYIYYSVIGTGLSRKLYQYYNPTGEVNVIGNTEGPYFPFFDQVDETIYYSHSDTLFVCKGDIVSNYYPIGIDRIYSVLISYKGINYINTSEGIYSDGTDGIELIYEGEVTDFKQYGEYIFFISDDQSFTIFDGESFQKTTLDSPDYLIGGMNQEHLVLYSYDTNLGLVPRLFNMGTSEMIELDPGFNTKRIEGTFNVAGHQILIASRRNSQSTTLVELFSYNGEFESFELLESYEHNGFYTNFSFHNINDGGVLYVGSRIYVVDGGANFNLLDLAGDFRNTDLLESEGYLYFRAFDPDFGRQVFRLKKSNVLSQDEELLPELVLYPNPASDYFSVSSDHLIDRYRLFSLNGELVLKSESINENSITLDVSSLESGIYTLCLLYKNGKKSCNEVVKI